MTTAGSSRDLNAAANGQEDKAGLDFYFGRPTEMMRKLETSKPVRRTKVEKKTGAPESDKVGSDAVEPQGAYLFKWQREAEEDEEDDEDGGEEDVTTKAKVRWAAVTGNMQPSSLSIGAYFEKDGQKGKPLRDGLVNAGGVVMIQPGLIVKGGGNKLNLNDLVGLNETGGGKGGFYNQDAVLSLRSKNEDDTGEATDSISTKRGTEERLVFNRRVQWPPEAPGFPPPPPDGNETVQPKKVHATAMNVPVKRFSRVAGKMLPEPPGTNRLAALSELGIPQSKLATMQRQTSNMSDISTNGQMQVMRTRSPSIIKDMIPKTVEPKKNGFLRRISFMPGMGSKKDDGSVYPGLYTSLIMVPYILPPPPQPPKYPAPGSNEERKLQKLHLKHMFLEDMYSAVIELADEKIRLNETCRDLEAQITEADITINSLIGANEQ